MATKITEDLLIKVGSNIPAKLKLGPILYDSGLYSNYNSCAWATVTDDNGLCYLIAGFDYDVWANNKQCVVFDPETKTFTQKTPVPTTYATYNLLLNCASYNSGKIYLAIWNKGSYYWNTLFKEIWIYDIASDTWSLVSIPYEFQDVGKNGMSVYHNGFVYLFANYYDYYWVRRSTGIKYDVQTNTFTSVTPNSVPHELGNIGGVYNDKIYIFDFSVLCIYDPILDTWQLKYLTPTFYPSSSYLCGKIINNSMYVYSAGWDVIKNVFQMFDLDTETTSFFDTIVIYRNYPFIFHSNNKIYIGGWYNNTFKYGDVIYPYQAESNMIEIFDINDKKLLGTFEDVGEYEEKNCDVYVLRRTPPGNYVFIPYNKGWWGIWTTREFSHSPVEFSKPDYRFGDVVIYCTYIG